MVFLSHTGVFRAYIYRRCEHTPHTIIFVRIQTKKTQVLTDKATEQFLPRCLDKTLSLSHLKMELITVLQGREVLVSHEHKARGTGADP